MTPNPTPRVSPKGLEFESLKGKLSRRPVLGPNETSISDPSQPNVATPPEPSSARSGEQPAGVGESTPEPSTSAKQPVVGGERTLTSPTSRRRGPSPKKSGAAGRRAEPSVGEVQPARRRVAFTLPVDLRDALAERARDSTQAEVIFDAIETHLDDIPALLIQAHPVPAGRLFERTRREPQQHRVPTTVWMSMQNVANIDELAAKHHAATRTQLLEVVLRRYLQSVQ